MIKKLIVVFYVGFLAIGSYMLKIAASDLKSGHSNVRVLSSYDIE